MPQLPRDEWITIDGLSFHYRNWGGSGQPLVLLHGLASTCRIWDLVAPLLSEDFAVVAMDQRGHGESAKPDYGYDFETVSQDAKGLIEALNLEAPIVIGHSWGGDVAMELALNSPGLPKGLCFVDGGMINPSANYSSLAEAREQMSPPVFGGVASQELLERVRKGPLGASISPEVESIVLANFEIQEDRIIGSKLSRENHIRIIEALWDHHPPDLYPEVKCPVLVIPARQQSDSATAERRESRELSVSVAEEGLPVSKTVWLEDSIHDVPIQRPGLVAGIIKDHITDGFFG